MLLVLSEHERVREHLLGWARSYEAKKQLSAYILYVTKIFTEIALTKELIINYLVSFFYLSAIASVVGNNFGSVKNRS